MNLTLVSFNGLFAESSTVTYPDESLEKSYVESLKEPGLIEIQDYFIVYSGSINKINNENLFNLYENTDPSPTWLAINSGGGDVNFGMELGEWIHENKLNVYIPDWCLSSCANYVFTAGIKVVLEKNTVIGWHGSPVASDLWAGTPAGTVQRQRAIRHIEKWNPEITNPRRHHDATRIRNRRFFRTVGVHPVITSLSVVADESSFAKIEQAGSYMNYLAYISLEDMKYFGVDNVVVDGGATWNPRFDDQVDGDEDDGGRLIKITLEKGIEKRLAELKYQLNQVE